MDSPGRWALAGLVVSVVAGCGAATNRSTGTGTGAGTGQATSYAQAVNVACNANGSDGKPANTSCVFALVDGRRFSCPQRFAHAVQTAASLERSRSCRKLAPLHLSAAVRRVTAAIESAQACLTSHKVRTIGSAMLPPLASPNSPDGELIAGYLPDGALIAFYRSIEKAERLAPAVLRNARRLHSQVERAGAVTIFWSRPPTTKLRGAVQACLAGA
jgi:hypothetical protein